MTESSEQKIQYFDAKYLDPKYPIVKSDPAVDDVIKAMRFTDYLSFAGVVAGTWTYGFLLGKPVRGPTAVMCASAGFTFAMFYTMQNVRGRLLGYRENAQEVTKWGIESIQPRRYQETDGRHPQRQAMVTRFPLRWDNYD
jgi:hypothetical protein